MLKSKMVFAVYHAVAVPVLTGGSATEEDATILQTTAAAVAMDALGLALGQARVADERVVELAVQTRALVLTLRVLRQVAHVCLTHVVARLGLGTGAAGRRLQVGSCVHGFRIDIVRVSSIPEPAIGLASVLEVRQDNAGLALGVVHRVIRVDAVASLVAVLHHDGVLGENRVGDALVLPHRVRLALLMLLVRLLRLALQMRLEV